MHERSVLLAQIGTLEQELARAESSLSAPQLDPRLRERVRIRFEKLFKQQRDALAAIRQSVELDRPLAACWSGFRATRWECTYLFRECLAFMQGALVRKAELDAGLCQIADALLDDLSRRADIFWERFTILAEGEFFLDMAEIIRVRFPEISLWNLPVAAHEFGHFVGPEIQVRGPDGRSQHPFEVMLEVEQQRGAKYRAYLHEYFADLFATYALGPAFACTCLLLRFDPAAAGEETSYHPSDGRRAYLILRMLARMDAAEGGIVRPYLSIIDELQGLWEQSVAAANSQLDALLDQLYTLLDAELPGVRYRGWLQAQRLAAELRPDRYAAPAFQDGDTLADVLNAAWLCRLQRWDAGSDAVRRIGERAVDLCRQIMARTHSQRR